MVREVPKVYQRINIGVHIVREPHLLNLLINSGVPSFRLLLCPTGYSTSTSSRMVPSLSSTRRAFPIERLAGSWYSTVKRWSSTQKILARRASIRGSAAAASVLSERWDGVEHSDHRCLLALRSEFTEDKGIRHHIVDRMACDKDINIRLRRSNATLTRGQQSYPRDLAYRWCA